MTQPTCSSSPHSAQVDASEQNPDKTKAQNGSAPVTRTRSSVNPAALVRSPAIVLLSRACSGTSASSTPTPQNAAAAPSSRAIISKMMHVSSGPAQANTQNGPKSSNRRTSFDTKLTTRPAEMWPRAAPLKRSSLPCTAAIACTHWQMGCSCGGRQGGSLIRCTVCAGRSPRADHEAADMQSAS